MRTLGEILDAGLAQNPKKRPTLDIPRYVGFRLEDDGRGSYSKLYHECGMGSDLPLTTKTMGGDLPLK